MAVVAQTGGKGGEEDDENGKKPSSARPRKRAGQRSKNQARMKIIVRRLPPNLPEKVFESSVEKWIEDTDWWTFVSGKLAKSQAKISVFSTAYLNFKTIEVMLDFCNKYNGHVFVDGRGIESRAVVEFAPFQRIPKKKKKRDTRVNTIEEDADYVKFLKSLEEAQSNKGDDGHGLNTDTQLEKLEKKLMSDQLGLKSTTVVTSGTTYASTTTSVAQDKPKSTPLLEALRAKKANMRAALELNKQANLARKALADRKADDSKNTEKGKTGGKSAGSTKSGKKGDAAKTATQATPSAIAKRQSSPSVEQEGKSPAKLKGREPSKREKIAPPGSLFNKSIGAVLGTREIKKGRSGEAKKKADSATESGAAYPAPQTTEREEVKGRGYKSKRQAFVSDVTAGDASEFAGGPVRGVGTASVDNANGKVEGETPVKTGGRNRRGGKGREISEVPVGQRGKGKETSAEGTETIRSKPSRSRMASNSSSITSTDPAAKRTGPSVTIMKRDGTSSNFNTRDTNVP
ncbi:Smg-4/UPF3 family-domain-containing protein [Powellomyces hirtus]|nr:Smg-4/UPF3 family-domain-containing protein [Powellomyces hirtus]